MSHLPSILTNLLILCVPSHTQINGSLWITLMLSESMKSGNTGQSKLLADLETIKFLVKTGKKQFLFLIGGHWWGLVYQFICLPDHPSIHQSTQIASCSCLNKDRWMPWIVPGKGDMSILLDGLIPLDKTSWLGTIDNPTVSRVYLHSGLLPAIPLCPEKRILFCYLKSLLLKKGS